MLPLSDSRWPPPAAFSPCYSMCNQHVTVRVSRGRSSTTSVRMSNRRAAMRVLLRHQRYMNRWGTPRCRQLSDRAPAPIDAGVWPSLPINSNDFHSSPSGASPIFCDKVQEPVKADCLRVVNCSASSCALDGDFKHRHLLERRRGDSQPPKLPAVVLLGRVSSVQ